MGTDRAPRPEVAGALEATEGLGPGVEIVLVGDRTVVEAEVERLRPSGLPGRISVHHAPDRVAPHDQPSKVMRRRPRSSVVVGLGLHRKGEVDAFVSAGPTGAVMTAALFSLKRIPGVLRPAIAATIPTIRGRCLLVDSGANVECKPRHLLQFARLGSAYVRRALGRANPTVGLLNVGEEPGKGGEMLAETHRLLRADKTLNFIGNVEGRDLVTSACDVVTCDGFVGNVLLKFYESVSAMTIRLLNDGLSRISATQDDLARAFRALDYAEVGGAPLLGVRGVPIICHGGSSPKAICNALYMAARAAHTGVVKHSAREFQSLATLKPA